ncbi:exodeoxyribonuclease I [Hahella sp. KA22]|uniref:exodeoxyribonuclease I n=1 Tax=Hahella sp. KA22 TaxID=1628392 RepID=UPI000FDCDF1C|nr:exodeoxyribonuclease I [Hahella sp. KA22]AZZ91124.1 exodeoxyribonuclease I [Hahella sp. KA22]QAY54492.1 exodeoxyribonuclease I [Hahella sp. KA22]
MADTFYWYDFETWGADPRRDRPSQFAGVRTDLDLNPIEEPLVMYCKPAEDVLPQPEACLITGITPQKALSEGVSEAEFIRLIHEQFSRPGTCVVGYNSIRFDDEVTRNTLYRNFYDPYSREWRNGNSRWDVIDMVRLTYAMRPEGINWPRNAEGVPSFRLEELTKANGVTHEAAHDAMSDVYATIAVARLIKTAQPKLYDYVLGHRNKKVLEGLVDIERMKPLFHVSSKFPAAMGCCAMVAPIARHPTNPNGVIVYDLRADPSTWTHLPVEKIRERIFTSNEDLPEGAERIPLKVVHLNKCPILVESKILKTMDPERLRGFQLDGDKLRSHLQALRQVANIQQLVAEVFNEPMDDSETDPDLMLYSGGFFSNNDRELMTFIHEQSPEVLGELELPFEDPRLQEMLFRYRARNFPGTLNEEEMEKWERYRYHRLAGESSGASISFQAYFKKLEQLAANPDITPFQLSILQDLHLYGESIIPMDF